MKKKIGPLKLHRETLRRLTLVTVTGGISAVTCLDSCDGTCTGEICNFSGPEYCSNQPGCETYAVC